MFLKCVTDVLCFVRTVHSSRGLQSVVLMQLWWLVWPKTLLVMLHSDQMQLVTGNCIPTYMIVLWDLLYQRSMNSDLKSVIIWLAKLACVYFYI